jgi:hypothetical protein
VVDLIEARHLIRADVRAGAHWYEISHDRLVEPILRSNAEWEQTGQSPLHRSALRWQDSDKNSDLLYRVDTLKKGREFAEANRDSCEPIDFEFLEESQKAQAAVEREQRQHRLIRRLAIGVLTALALASLAGIFAFRERDRANNQAQVAEQQRVEADNQRLEAQKQRADAETQRNLAATERDNANAQAARADDEALRAKTRELLAQANVFRDSQIPRSILLALEAYSSARKTGDVALLQEAGDNVRRIVIGAGGVPLLGHQGAVNAVDWSNNGTKLLTAAVDGGVLVHAAPFSLTPTLRLLGPTSATVAADLSPDGAGPAVSDDKPCTCGDCRPSCPRPAQRISRRPSF